MNRQWIEWASAKVHDHTEMFANSRPISSSPWPATVRVHQGPDCPDLGVVTFDPDSSFRKPVETVMAMTFHNLPSVASISFSMTGTLKVEDQDTSAPCLMLAMVTRDRDETMMIVHPYADLGNMVRFDDEAMRVDAAFMFDEMWDALADLEAATPPDMWACNKHTDADHWQELVEVFVALFPEVLGATTTTGIVIGNM